MLSERLPSEDDQATEIIGSFRLATTIHLASSCDVGNIALVARIPGLTPRSVKLSKTRARQPCRVAFSSHMFGLGAWSVNFTKRS